MGLKVDVSSIISVDEENEIPIEVFDNVYDEKEDSISLTELMDAFDKIRLCLEKTKISMKMKKEIVEMECDDLIKLLSSK